MNNHRPASLDSYRNDLRGLVKLEAEAERALARRWRDGDAGAGAQLVEASLPFVIRIARDYRRWGIPLEDLIQQGNLGLLKAARKYDPARECRLVSYAVFWIRAEIRDFVVRGYRIVRLGSTRTERKAIRAFRRGLVDNASELAEASGMPKKRAQRLWPILMRGDFALDAAVGEAASPLQRLPAEAETPEELVAQYEEAQSTRRRVGAALAVLPERERRIIERRYLSEEPPTLAALGEEMGVSKERVRQLEARARGRLRVALETDRRVAA